MEIKQTDPYLLNLAAQRLCILLYALEVVTIPTLKGYPKEVSKLKWNNYSYLDELMAVFSSSLQLQKYYQRRKSHRTVSVVLHGEKVPLYGAGAGMSLSNTGGAVPLTLDFDVISRGYVIGKLVRVKHRKHISCPLVVDSSKNKPIKFSQNACTYL